MKYIQKYNVYLEKLSDYEWGYIDVLLKNQPNKEEILQKLKNIDPSTENYYLPKIAWIYANETKNLNEIQILFREYLYLRKKFDIDEIYIDNKWNKNNVLTPYLRINNKDFSSEYTFKKYLTNKLFSAVRKVLNKIFDIIGFFFTFNAMDPYWIGLSTNLIAASDETTMCFVFRMIKRNTTNVNSANFPSKAGSNAESYINFGIKGMCGETTNIDFGTKESMLKQILNIINEEYGKISDDFFIKILSGTYSEEKKTIPELKGCILSYINAVMKYPINDFFNDDFSAQKLDLDNFYKYFSVLVSNLGSYDLINKLKTKKPELYNNIIKHVDKDDFDKAADMGSMGYND